MPKGNVAKSNQVTPARNLAPIAEAKPVKNNVVPKVVNAKGPSASKQVTPSISRSISTATLTGQGNEEGHAQGQLRQRAFSEAFATVYPRRSRTAIQNIGTNPVSTLSLYDKSRLGLDIPHFKSDNETTVEKSETDLQYCTRRLKEFYRACCVVPAISCYLCCKSIVMTNYTTKELTELYQPRTLNSTPYLKYLKTTLEELPERDWKGELIENLLETVKNSIVSASHLEKLGSLMTQFRTTLAYSDLYASTSITPIEFPKLKGRSMAASFVYMITFMITELDRTDERLHQSAMRYIRKLYLELMSESIMLWSSTCHIVTTAEIILEDFEHVIGKYLFNIKSRSSQVVNLKEKADYNEQARVRFILRKEKKLRDERIMNHKIHWPSKVPVPSKPNLLVVSRIEETNIQWHPISHFNFPAQIRIVVNLIKRTKNIIADAFTLLTEFDRTLHTHRPSRKDPATETLFEDVIYLKDRCMELNTFPSNLLNDEEVEWLYEVGRVLSDKLDDLYILLFASKDVAKETVHVSQLCHEFLKKHDHWDVDTFHFMAKEIQTQCHHDWDHYEGFRGREPIYKLEDPIPLFYASIYPSLIRMFPVKVARIFLSFQSPEELKTRREPSSHSLWDAFDIIPNNAYPKQEEFRENK